MKSWKSHKYLNTQNKFKCKSAWSHFLHVRFPHGFLCHAHMHVLRQQHLNSEHSSHLQLPPSTWDMAVCSHLSPTRWPGYHGIREKKSNYTTALPGRDGLSTSFMFKITRGSLALWPAHFVTLSEFRPMWGFLHSKKPETYLIYYAQNQSFKDRWF